jgi:hypothetical protein
MKDQVFTVRVKSEAVISEADLNDAIHAYANENFINTVIFTVTPAQHTAEEFVEWCKETAEGSNIGCMKVPLGNCDHGVTCKFNNIKNCDWRHLSITDKFKLFNERAK